MPQQAATKVRRLHASEVDSATVIIGRDEAAFFTTQQSIMLRLRQDVPLNAALKVVDQRTTDSRCRRIYLKVCVVLLKIEIQIWE